MNNETQALSARIAVLEAQTHAGPPKPRIGPAAAKPAAARRVKPKPARSTKASGKTDQQRRLAALLAKFGVPSVFDIPAEALLDRSELAAAFWGTGFGTTPATLETWATRRVGPPSRKWGSAVRYEWAAALKWARERLSEPRMAAAEHRHPHGSGQSESLFRE
jgi:hypothetical protein